MACHRGGLAVWARKWFAKYQWVALQSQIWLLSLDRTCHEEISGSIQLGLWLGYTLLVIKDLIALEEVNLEEKTLEEKELTLEDCDGQVGWDGEGGAGAGHPPDGWKPLLQVFIALICLDFFDLSTQVNFLEDFFVRVCPKYFECRQPLVSFLKTANLVGQMRFSPCGQKIIDFWDIWPDRCLTSWTSPKSSWRKHCYPGRTEVVGPEWLISIGTPQTPCKRWPTPPPSPPPSYHCHCCHCQHHCHHRHHNYHRHNLHHHHRVHNMHNQNSNWNNFHYNHQHNYRLLTNPSPSFQISNTDHIIDVNKGVVGHQYDRVNIICPYYTTIEGQQRGERHIIYRFSFICLKQNILEERKTETFLEERITERLNSFVPVLVGKTTTSAEWRADHDRSETSLIPASNLASLSHHL